MVLVVTIFQVNSKKHNIYPTTITFLIGPFYSIYLFIPCFLPRKSRSQFFKKLPVIYEAYMHSFKGQKLQNRRRKKQMRRSLKVKFVYTRSEEEIWENERRGRKNFCSSVKYTS